MHEMEYTYYAFRMCVGAYFEVATEDARRLLPDHLQPLEVQHERSILAITAFHFTESLCGSYHEVVLAVVVPPMVEPGRPMPKAAFFPFMVGTSTEISRQHAIDRWHLPHYMSDLDICFEGDDSEVMVRVRDGKDPVLDLTVTNHEFEPVRNVYNCFTVDTTSRYKVNIFMEAPHAEHEEERGALKLYEHPMTAGLSIGEVSEYPFREEWYRGGMQTFEELERI
ncbi:MAG TPA: hypothetical protein VFQ22_03895 [Longimicrobiales bacterium]|nr:hypothetical protein [Longimicrobiales bacterium]